MGATPRQAEVAFLRVVEARSNTWIAAELDVTEATIKRAWLALGRVNSPGMRTTEELRKMYERLS